MRASKNGTFLFLRDYMEYHHERFTDHSLLFYDSKERLVALLPAHETETEGIRTLASHMGLTYGGLVLTAKVGAADVLDIFDSLNRYAQENGFRRITYKPVPTIYHLLPAEEDRYALFRVGAVQEACNISCVVSLKTTCSFFAERRRFRGKHRAENLGYHVAEGTLADFWPILEGNLLQRYGARPVHSLAEMQYLQGCFPQQIRCYLALDAQGQPQAGAVLYVSQQTVHVQYGHCTPQGRQDGALDLSVQQIEDGDKGLDAFWATVNDGTKKRGGCCAVLTNGITGTRIFVMITHGCLDADARAQYATQYKQMEQQYSIFMENCK